MIAAGESAPDFTLPGTEGDSIAKYSLTESVETGGVVLVFYPFDFSDVCTGELCSFRDAEFLTFTEGLDVFGLSLDSYKALKRFIRQNELNFPLLSDTRRRVTDPYGLAHEELNDHEGVPKRAVDDTRTTRYCWKTGGTKRRAQSRRIPPDGQIARRCVVGVESVVARMRGESEARSRMTGILAGQRTPSKSKGDNHDIVIRLHSVAPQ
ncbi:hypothetical protein BRC75_06340 [Halobacteriales archaeon QH_7_69_31]|nr:MAG: hypothetical protein BRC75_06340 [Halobacteriales archaeon QH_7_69_31]